MENKIAPVNEVFVRGSIESIERNDYGNRVMTIVCLVRRGKEPLKLDFVLEGNVGRGFGRKDRVLVTGYTKAFTYHNEALQKSSEVMYFVATNVEKDKSELEQRFGVKGFFYPEPMFRAFIAGTVVKVVKPDSRKWARLTVETCGGGHDLRPSYTTLRYYAAGKLPLFDYLPGDKVAVRCSAYTPEKTISNKKVRRFQNLIVEDIAYLERVPRANDDQKPKMSDPFSFGLHGAAEAGTPASPAGSSIRRDTVHKETPAPALVQPKETKVGTDPAVKEPNASLRALSADNLTLPPADAVLEPDDDFFIDDSALDDDLF